MPDATHPAGQGLRPRAVRRWPLAAAAMALACVLTEPTAASAATLHHVARPGDTLIGLGKRYLADPRDWPAVQRLNRVADPRRIPVGTILRIPAGLLRAAPGKAVALQVDGDVQWRPSAGAPWRRLDAGQALARGAEIRTAADSAAVLALDNGTQLRLQPDSEATIARLLRYADGALTDSRLTLRRGQVDVDDNPRHKAGQDLRVDTPGAQATVRGTHFRVDYGGGVTRETTLDGSVDLISGGMRVRLDKGQGSLSRDGEPPRQPVALLAAPDLSGVPSRLRRLPARLSWLAQPGAAQWIAQIVTSGSPGRLVEWHVVDVPALPIGALPDGDYRLEVSALDVHGLQGYQARHAFEVAAHPFPPLLQAPGDAGVVRHPRPHFAWTPVQGAARYRLQLARQAGFANPLFDVETVAADWAAEADLPAGESFWRVASISADGREGPWSNAFSLRYIPAPGPAEIGRASIRYSAGEMDVDLPPPPPGQHYRLVLSGPGMKAGPSETIESVDGKAHFARPASGTYRLEATLEDDHDGTAGPVAVREIRVPDRYPGLWLLLVPLLPAL